MVIRLFICCTIALAGASAHAEAVSGSAQAIDGDSLTVGGREVRLFGIDAPEFTQSCNLDGQPWTCGKDAASQLSGLLEAAEVFCEGEETDAYGRLVAVCMAGSYEVNRAMVAGGWAVAFRRYSMAYVADETRAKSARHGIWRSTFDLPESYRLAKELPQQEARERRLARQAPQQGQRSTFAGGCVIKGNHSRRGEWIYHLPGMPYYDETRPEAMFCSEAEARAAGYRRAIVR